MPRGGHRGGAAAGECGGSDPVQPRPGEQRLQLGALPRGGGREAGPGEGAAGARPGRGGDAAPGPRPASPGSWADCTVGPAGAASQGGAGNGVSGAAALGPEGAGDERGAAPGARLRRAAAPAGCVGSGSGRGGHPAGPEPPSRLQTGREAKLGLRTGDRGQVVSTVHFSVPSLHVQARRRRDLVKSRSA